MEDCFPRLTPQLAGFSGISLGCWGQVAETSRALRSSMVPSVSEATPVRQGSWEFKLPTQCWAHTMTSTKAMLGTES